MAGSCIRNCDFVRRPNHLPGAKEVKYILIIPAVLLGAAVALYVWAVRQPNVFENMDEAYN